ncbi:DUF4304 domain-containing protein [Fulvivirga maritima]|uniref:DUF4304 domain-containing protein n=1 Tax=Fulvivirga maritima TaxID=2904247 RepID=UPI001F1DC1BB|nr:DUF4304 domain-containing protein [Fulvivirga maritima]UII25072.1 DUF4304 domain-containing protein [Fulvivirga maritima]
MSDLKEKFNLLVKESISPFLKSAGFKKAGLNYYLHLNDLVMVINLQKSHGNSFEELKFYVNFGIHSSSIDEVLGLPTNHKPKEHECYYHNRIHPMATDSFLITSATSINLLFEELISTLKTALTKSESIKSTTDLADLMIENNGLYKRKELCLYLLLSSNDERLKTYVQLLHEKFKEDQRWAKIENSTNEMLAAHKRNYKMKDIIK